MCEDATRGGPVGREGSVPGPAELPGGRPADDEERQLLREAEEAASHAYAPYSGFRVGAVAMAGSGRRAAGVNVENASFPVGQCAERVALGSLVAAGERDLAVVAVAAADGTDLLPCGACLQALSEFGDPRIVARVGGDPTVFPLHELLTAPFCMATDRPSP